MPELKTSGDSDFLFKEIKDSSELNRSMFSLIENLYQAKGFELFDDLQILCPIKRGDKGVYYYNEYIQDKYNKNKPVKIGMRIFKKDDKVMQIKNNYNKEIFNGDIGKIIEINEDDREILIQFDDKIVRYDHLDWDEITLAYACTIHKAQGSEYPWVILPLTTDYYVMLQRNLLYTAITRGQERVVLVGSVSAIQMAVKTNKVVYRLTDLKEKLKYYGEEYKL
jgi:exodeoxyribonuclease V alpha subunit